MTLPTDCLAGHRVFVTGAGGVLGHRIATAASGMGASVMAVDTRSLDRIRQTRGGVSRVQADLADVSRKADDFLLKAPAGKRTVFHMAGMADQQRCDRLRHEAVQANIDLTVHGLEICRRTGGCTMVFPSTGIVYGDRLSRPALETDTVAAESFYAATKLAAEQIVEVYAKRDGVSAVIARLSNVYGPGIGENTVVGKIVAQAVRGGPLQVAASNPVRDFIFSADVVEALIRLALNSEKAPEHRIVNVSSGVGIGIGDLVDCAARVFGTARLPAEQPGRVSYLVLDNRVLHQQTGWWPETELSDGLRQTYDHHLSTHYSSGAIWMQKNEK